MVLAPIGGVLEWRVEPGARVALGAVLGWIAGPGRCGLVPLRASRAGRLTWRRASALEVVFEGEPAALIDGDEAELGRCRDAERDALGRALAALELERAQLTRSASTPLAQALLGTQRAEVERRLTLLRGLLDAGE